MKKISEKKSAKIYYLMAFVIPVVIMLLIYGLLNQFPFGKMSLIVEWDMKEQYFNYFEYYKTFLNSNNMMYSFSKVLGGDLIGLTAYYLSSPFNLLLLVFKDVSTDKILLLISLLKIGFSGLSLSVLMKYLIKKVDYLSLLFVLPYALMSYTIIYQQNLMWLDGLVWLPIIILGIYKIINEKSFFLYSISMFIMIISNYYIGYMIGVFSLFHFIYVLINSNCYEKGFRKNYYREGVKNYLFGVMFTIGLSAFWLVPIGYSLAGGKGPFSSNDSGLLNFSFIMNPLDLFSKLFTGSFIWDDVLAGLPAIFVSMFIFVLVILFFLNSKISKKEKITSLCFLIILILSMSLKNLNAFWHGLNSPTGFPGRYSFVFSFLLIILAFRCFQNLFKGNKKSHLIIALLIISFMGLVAFGVNYKHLQTIHIVIALIISFLVIGIFYFAKRRGYFSIVLVVLLGAVIITDVGINGYSILIQYSFIPMGYMDEYIEHYKPVYESIEENDKGTYRIKKDFSESKNDHMLFNIKGLTHYSSSEKQQPKDILFNLGYFKNGKVYAAYNSGSTFFADSFIGVKYFLSQASDKVGYELVEEKGDSFRIYKNPYAFPLGFEASNTMSLFEFNVNNRFESQNRLASLLFGQEETLLENVAVSKVELRNVNEKRDEHEVVYTKDNIDIPAFVDYYIKMDKDGYIFSDFMQDWQNIASVFVNDKPIYNMVGSQENIINIGAFKKDEIVKVSIRLDDLQVNFNNEFFYIENIERLRTLSDSINNKVPEIALESSSKVKIKAEIEKDDSVFLFTVPYEKAWKAIVDNKEVATIDAGGFLAIPITKGFHEITLTYYPDEIFVGKIITFYTLIVLSIVLCRKNYFKQKSKGVKSYGNKY